MGILEKKSSPIGEAGIFGSCLRILAFAAILTPLIIATGCSGSKGGGGGVGATLGKICNETSSTYSVELEGAGQELLEVEQNPIASKYVGSVGGQIRAVEKFSFVKPGGSLFQGMAWGLGAAIRYGTPDEIMGLFPLKKPGGLTGLSQINVDGTNKFVFSTENGMGLLVLDESGYFGEEEGSYRPVLSQNGPFSGVLSIDARMDGSVIAFTTPDGYLQTTSAKALSSGEKCADILTTASKLNYAGENYLPVKVKLGTDRAFVLAKPFTAVTSVAPTYEEAYGPLFMGLVSTVPPAIVRSVGLGDHKVLEAGFTAADGSFGSRDGFIPTDIAYDDGVLYVAGLAFRSLGVSNFLVDNCPSAESAEEKTKCLLAAASDDGAALTVYGDLHPVTGGVFVYRNLDDLSKASYFKVVPVSVFPHDTKAPPFTYRIAVKDSQGYVRGPNFFLPMTRSDSSEEEENWTLGKEVDLASGLESGIPNDIIIMSNATASSFTAIKNADGSGASALEYGNSGGITVRDRGAVYVRVEGGGSNADGVLIAAIEMESEKGGRLYLENTAERVRIYIDKNLIDENLIDTGAYANSYVARADYDGENLVFAWSSTGPEGKTEETEPWRLAIQKGKSSATREEKELVRAETPEGIFKGFPDAKTNAVGDVFISKKGKVAVLFTGGSEGKRYFQVALYDTTLNLKGVSLARGPVAGSHLGRVLKIDGSTVLFSAPDGIYSWTAGIGDATPQKKLALADLVDVSVDPTGKSSRIAIVSGFKIDIRDVNGLSNSLFEIPLPKAVDYAGSRLAGARVAMSNNLLFLSVPYGLTSSRLLMFDILKGASQVPKQCQSCNALDVNVFEADPRFLLVSGAASGIEIYDLSR